MCRTVIPDSHVDILEKKSFAHVATLDPDGSPHVTPVWVDHRGCDAVLINTTRDRRKKRNLRHDARVSVSVLDPDDPYRYVRIDGEAVEITRDGAVDHINELARQYMDVAEYPHLDEDDDPRVIVRIAADDVSTMG